MNLIEYLRTLSDALAAHPDQSDISQRRRILAGRCPKHDTELVTVARLGGGKQRGCVVQGCDYEEKT
jgi:hypothetical protein